MAWAFISLPKFLNFQLFCEDNFSGKQQILTFVLPIHSFGGEQLKPQGMVWFGVLPTGVSSASPQLLALRLTLQFRGEALGNANASKTWRLNRKAPAKIRFAPVGMDEAR